MCFRVNAYPVGNAVFEGLNLVARNPGRCLVYCRLTYHFRRMLFYIEFTHNINLFFALHTLEHWPYC